MQYEDLRGEDLYNMDKCCEMKDTEKLKYNITSGSRMV